MKAGEVLKKITPHVSSISLVGWLLVLAVQGSAWIYQTYFSLGDVVIAAVPICERYSFGPEAESPNFDGDQAVFNRNWKDYKYVGVTIFASRTVSDVRIRFRRVFHVVRWGIVSDGLSDPELEAFLSELPTGSLRSAEFIMNMSGSHTLERFINEVARDVTDPQTGVSVFERRHARRLAGGDTDDLGATGDHRISALGSGSDYTPFLQHLGIASMNLGFGGESGGGSYHSIFDSFDHYTRFIDPTFEYGIALAQTAGRAVLRLADAELLPWDFTAFEATVTRYADEVMMLADDMREETSRHNRLVRDGRFELAADPT